MGVGARLAEAREAAGLSVEELSRCTRVREALINAIERDDFSLCGGDFYARGHVRNLSTFLGIDAEAMVHEFDQMHGGVPLPVRASGVFQAERPIKIRDRHALNWTMAMGVALVVVVVFGVVKTMGGDGDTTTAEVREISVPAPSPSTSIVKAPEPSRKEASLSKPGNGTVVFQVRAERSTRLTVRDAGGRRLFSGTLPAGKTSVWRAKNGVRVTFADAGAVSLLVNGKELGVPGRPGQSLKRFYGASAGSGR
ncbi:membrane protein [Planobispora rosea]|uniref:Membrane protein n=1 Tax=Planobispora rosea TaxID=35762 RepID=A0A8J3WAW0_PLARO|nr:RodZ domain-containing protein [Planobispora rosea]GGS46743.1 membrane protein [Planobispora rosea]GIH82308.1 membrane protein [Planobispora rosea]